MNANDKTGDTYLEYEETAMRLECLRLAVATGSSNPLKDAESFYSFIKHGPSKSPV